MCEQNTKFLNDRKKDLLQNLHFTNVLCKFRMSKPGFAHV